MIAPPALARLDALPAGLPLPDRIEAGPLLLCRPLPGDVAFATSLFALPEMVAHRPDPRPDPPERSRARILAAMAHWETHGFGVWTLRCAGRPVGVGGLTLPLRHGGLNLSYHLHPGARGQGHAGRVAGAALAVAFGPVGAARVVGLARPGNPASCRVLLRAGFRFEAEVPLGGAPTGLYAATRP